MSKKDILRKIEISLVTLACLTALLMLLFEPLLGSAAASSNLLLFRITTYYLPFLISIFLTIQMRFFLNTRTTSEAVSQH